MVRVVIMLKKRRKLTFELEKSTRKYLFVERVAPRCRVSVFLNSGTVKLHLECAHWKQQSKEGCISSQQGEVMCEEYACGQLRVC